VNLADAKGKSLLMLVSYNGNLETTRTLLEFGAEVDRRMVAVRLRSVAWRSRVITNDAEAGMTLACKLGEQLQAHHEKRATRLSVPEA